MALNLEAKLERVDPSTPWGFRMQGGKDFFSPLSIQRVNPGSLAAKCGLLTGDIIIKIGNTESAELRHKEAQNCIVSAGNRLDLLLQRGGPPPFVGGSGYDSFNAPTFNVPGPAPFIPQQSYGGPPKPSPVAFKPSFDAASLGQRSSDVPLSPVGSSAPSSQYGGYQPKPAPAPPSPASKPWSPSGSTTSSMGPPPSLGSGGQKPKPRRVRAGEAITKPPSTDRIPICDSCGTPIRGPFVTALGKCWCPDHFICANPQCGTKLIDIGFVEEGSCLYCERDYEKYMAPHCNKCSSAIMGECVNAMNATWHPTCFLCIQCGKPIGGNQFHIEEGKPYCEKDWASLFQTMCTGCDFPIEPGDRWVEAIGKNFHAECFNCSTCQVSLEGQAYVSKGGKAFCKKHAR